MKFEVIYFDYESEEICASRFEEKGGFIFFYKKISKTKEVFVTTISKSQILQITLLEEK